MNLQRYIEEGYNSRCEYLDGLAEQFGIDKSAVYALADILGPNEDFDALVTELEDQDAAGMLDDFKV